MHKRITAFIVAALIGVLATIGLAAPANAAQTDVLTCVYDGPNVTRVSGSMTVFVRSDGRIQADVTFYDYDAGGRDWDWHFKHNGDWSAQGTRHGDFLVSRTFLDFTGPDTIHFHTENYAKTVVCNAEITI